jgi:hypothetical protein
MGLFCTAHLVRPHCWPGQGARSARARPCGEIQDEWRATSGGLVVIVSGENTALSGGRTTVYLLLDLAVAARDFHQDESHPIWNMELFIDMVQVDLDGAFSDAQPFGD